jgi:small subunit ribosomal protein S1
MSASNEDALDREVAAALDGINLQNLDESGQPTRRDGEIVKKAGVEMTHGTVAGISGDDVIVELGPTMQGVISIAEFGDQPKVGQGFEFSMHGQEDGLWILSRKGARMMAAWNELQPGATCKAEVKGVNTGGLELKVGPLSAFMPASQVALHRIEDFSEFVGQHMECEVLEVEPEKKKVLLSRRKVLEREREEKRSEAMGRIVPGAKLTGTVSRIESFGAFVDLGGLEGLLHVSNISRKRVDDPNEVLKSGQQVEVLVLEIKEGGKRIGLGMKQLEPDPWDDARYKYPENSVLQGRVTRLMDFGGFVELEPGLEGLVHVSQLGQGRVNHARDVLKEGEELTVRVLSVDSSARRISLSRLDERGAVLGSEEAADGDTIDQVVRESGEHKATTNLGSLFKKALEGDG